MESLLERRNLTFAECSLAEEWEAVMRDALSALSASSAPPAGVFSEAVAFQQSLRPKNAESKRLVEERETFERCVEIAEKRAADHRDASLDVAFYSTDRMLRRAKANEAEHIAAAIRALKPGRDAT